MSPTTNDIPADDRCAICRTHKGLTASGRLWPLAVILDEKRYVKWICDECVRLFRPSCWAKTRRALAEVAR
jgi:hypothetical protein